MGNEYGLSRPAITADADIVDRCVRFTVTQGSHSSEVGALSWHDLGNALGRTPPSTGAEAWAHNLADECNGHRDPVHALRTVLVLVGLRATLRARLSSPTGSGATRRTLRAVEAHAVRLVEAIDPGLLWFTVAPANPNGRDLEPRDLVRLEAVLEEVRRWRHDRAAARYWAFLVEDLIADAALDWLAHPDRHIPGILWRLDDVQPGPLRIRAERIADSRDGTPRHISEDGPASVLGDEVPVDPARSQSGEERGPEPPPV